jgi:hypothetical protein
MFFENWEFVLANYVSYGCSRTDEQRKGKKRRKSHACQTQTICISCLFLKHAFRDLARMFFENWDFVLANNESYGCSRTREGKVTNVKLKGFAFLVCS